MQGKAYTREEFIDKYGSFIHREIKGTGIFFETVIAQAILESSGKVDRHYLVGASKLSRESHNLFGIKADKSWKGKRYNINTDEYTKSGVKYNENADFRVYPSYKASIKDYIKFLKKNPTYSKNGVFNSPDYYTQFKRLQKSGYATSPVYADSLKGVISPLAKKIADSKKKYKMNEIIKYSVLGILIFSGIFYYRKNFIKK